MNAAGRERIDVSPLFANGTRGDKEDHHNRKNRKIRTLCKKRKECGTRNCKTEGTAIIRSGGRS